MLKNVISPGLVDRNLTTIAIAQIIVLGLIALPLAGCGDDGPDGPIFHLSPHNHPTLHRVKMRSRTLTLLQRDLLTGKLRQQHRQNTRLQNTRPHMRPKILSLQP